jgi:hypothetical protein
MLGWPTLAGGAVLAGIIATGGGRVASMVFAKDSDVALIAHIVVALVLAGGAGVVLGTGDLLWTRWRSVGRR